MYFMAAISQSLNTTRVKHKFRIRRHFEKHQYSFKYPVWCYYFGNQSETGAFLYLVASDHQGCQFGFSVNQISQIWLVFTRFGLKWSWTNDHFDACRKIGWSKTANWYIRLQNAKCEQIVFTVWQQTAVPMTGDEIQFASRNSIITISAITQSLKFWKNTISHRYKQVSDIYK